MCLSWVLLTLAAVENVHALIMSRAERLPSPLTGFHHMVHGGEALEDGRADGAQDEQRRQAGVAHHGAPEQAASLVAPLEAPRQDAHEPVGQRDAGVLAPPPVHHQGHVETWKKDINSGKCFTHDRSDDIGVGRGAFPLF